jgi:sodium transport system ATP-binding protein
MQAILEINQVSKSFAKRKVVDNVSLHMFPGQVVGILGPNGAGKTTLLRMISTLLTPDSGNIRLAGFSSLERALELRSNLGLVNANMGIYERMSGRENLQLFASLAGLSKSETAERIEHLRASLDIADWIDARAKGYSTGMRQKILIGRAVIHRPKLLILDEASNGLDVFARRGLMDFVVQFSKAGGLVIYSTHIMSEAQELCDHIALLHEGRLLANDSLANLVQAGGSLEDAFFRLAKAQQQIPVGAN